MAPAIRTAPAPAEQPYPKGIQPCIGPVQTQGSARTGSLRPHTGLHSPSMPGHCPIFRETSPETSWHRWEFPNRIPNSGLLCKQESQRIQKRRNPSAKVHLFQPKAGANSVKDISFTVLKLQEKSPSGAAVSRGCRPDPAVHAVPIARQEKAPLPCPADRETGALQRPCCTWVWACFRIRSKRSWYSLLSMSPASSMVSSCCSSWDLS